MFGEGMLGKEETLKRLGAILAPKSPEGYRMVFALELKDIIIPVDRREDLITEQELVNLVCEAVINSFVPYKGSTIGCGSWKENRERLYRVLWGVDIGRALAARDFLGKPVECEYRNGAFWLSLLPEDGGMPYSERQLKWCRDNLPEFASNLTDREVIDAMYPAWEEFGDLSSSLPKPIDVSEEGREYICMLVSYAMKTARGEAND